MTAYRYHFETDGIDVFMVLAGERIAKLTGRRWEPCAAGWHVSGDLGRPVIVRTGP
jgi:hypothetical protein